MTDNDGSRRAAAAQKAQTEVDAEELHRHFVTFLENTSDFVYFKDEERRFLFCSQALADLTGHESWRDMIGKNDRDVFPAEVASVYDSEEQELYESGKALVGKLEPYRNPRGGAGWVQTNKWPVVDLSGKVIGLCGISRDATQNQQMLSDLRAQEERLELAGRLSYDVIYEWYPDTNRIDWHGQIDALVGLEEGAMGRLLEDWVSRVHPGDVGRIQRAIQLHAHDGTEYRYEYRVRHETKGWRIWTDRALPVFREDGTIQRWVGVCRDITESRKAEENRIVTEGVFEQAGEGIMVTTPTSTIAYVNAAFERITGYSRNEVIGQNPRILKSGHHGERFYAEMWEALTTRGRWTGEIWNRRKNGEVFPERLTISAIRDATGQLMNYVAMFDDITSQKEYEASLEHLANHDALTGLPNRALLHDRLPRSMARADRLGHFVAVGYLDLDGFKNLNDQYGHEFGNGLLVELAQRFADEVRASDTVARIGGDEFVFIFDGLKRPNHAIALASRMLESVRAPFNFDGQRLCLHASMGLSHYPSVSATHGGDLLRQADQAMYRAKQLGRDRLFVFGEESNDAKLNARHQLYEEFRNAIAEDQLTLHFQPQVNLSTGQVIGVEALVRWEHPTRGLLYPAAFLEVADVEPLVSALGEWVLTTSLRTLEGWAELGVDIRLSVNIHPHHLQRADFPERLAELLGAHPSVPPERLRLEVIESSALRDISSVYAVMSRCAALGVSFAIDDFGTGYASLTWLKHLPVEELKVDRTFISDMLDDPSDLAILEGVLGLCNALQLRVLAEGVETEEQGEFLLMLGCEHAQGYEIARPMTESSLLSWLGTWSPHEVWSRTRPVNAEDRFIVAFGVELSLWARVLDECSTKSTVPLSLASRPCRIHRWVRTRGKTQYAGLPEFDQLVVEHDRLHELASGFGHDLPTDELRSLVARTRQTVERLVELRMRLLQRIEMGAS